MRRNLLPVLVLVFACGGEAQPPGAAAPPAAAPAPPATVPAPSPTAAPPATAPAPPSATAPATPPATAAAPPPTAPAPAVPSGNLRGDSARGSTLYTQYCSSCHGPGGKGDGPVAAGLDPKPADHTDPKRMGPLDDPRLYTVITHGGAAVGLSPLMAPWGAVLADQDVRDLIAYIRVLSGT